MPMAREEYAESESFARLLSSIDAFANIYGAVRGIVHDPQHRPVQGAMVMLKSKTSDWAKTITTGASGEFEINAVPLGSYSVSVASPGFAQTAQDVTVISGTVPVIHFQLQMATATTRITPTIRPPIKRPTPLSVSPVASR